MVLFLRIVVLLNIFMRTRYQYQVRLEISRTTNLDVAMGYQTKMCRDSCTSPFWSGLARVKMGRKIATFVYKIILRYV